MDKLIKNQWRRSPDGRLEHAQILRHDVHPEGLSIERLRFLGANIFRPESALGHVVSIAHGRGALVLGATPAEPIALESGVHLYLPPGADAAIHGEPSMSLVRVTAPTPSQARGRRIIVRDEAFLCACATPTRFLRWVLTPQYLSRRIFLHHDETLLSGAGHPISWFHTTMFDVTGLPENADREPVFKMQYNYRTEPNVCFDVEGTARVRMALHPYSHAHQAWGDWLTLDNDSTYHVNEAACGPEEEWRDDVETGTPRPLRNKHEVYIRDGHVSLFCLFDPAPTGMEHHRPGEYSDYGPLSEVLVSEAYEERLAELTKLDDMVDRLSFAKARGDHHTLEGSAAWSRYLGGRRAQASLEMSLRDTLLARGQGRERVVERWMRPPIDDD